MADDVSLAEQVMNVLRLFDKIDPSKVCLEARFADDLGLGSLDLVEVLMAFEDEFGVEVSDEEAAPVHVVSEAVALIKSKLDG